MARKAAWRVWTRRLAPWLITGGVLVWIATKYSLTQIGDALQRGNALAAFAIVLVLPIVILVLVSQWDAMVIRAATGSARATYGQVLRAKAASSVLQIFGYGVGQGAYGVWIARRTGAGLKLGSGTTLYIVASDTCAVCVVGSLAMWFGDVAVAAGLRWGVLGALVALLALVAIGPHTGARKDGVFGPWVVVPRHIGLLGIAGRTLNIGLHVLTFWLAQRVFGLGIPFVAFASYVPVLLVIASLPINVAGFGPVQVAWIKVFEPWASGPEIIAFQVILNAGMGVATVGRGLPFVKRITGEVDEGAG